MKSNKNKHIDSAKKAHDPAIGSCAFSLSKNPLFSLVENRGFGVLWDKYE